MVTPTVTESPWVVLRNSRELRGADLTLYPYISANGIPRPFLRGCFPESLGTPEPISPEQALAWFTAIYGENGEITTDSLMSLIRDEAEALLGSDDPRVIERQRILEKLHMRAERSDAT